MQPFESQTLIQCIETEVMVHKYTAHYVCTNGITTTSNREEESDAFSTVDSTMDKEAKSSAELTPLSITMLYPTAFLIPPVVAYSFY